MVLPLLRRPCSWLERLQSLLSMPMVLPPRRLLLSAFDDRLQSSLIVLLPSAAEIHRTFPLLNSVTSLSARSVLPAVHLGSPEHLRLVLSSPPRNTADAVCRHLIRRGLLRNPAAQREVHRIFELAPEVPSITKLAKRMYASRRTLGRHFASAGLPVPSHWLQFARLLHVCIRLQSDDTAIFRIATRLGYPDGFTMSNQMKRMIGHRPSEVRQYLGWEWIVEAWLRRESAEERIAL
jgi:AraC-like DNA-binding protein